MTHSRRISAIRLRPRALRARCARLCVFAIVTLGPLRGNAAAQDAIPGEAQAPFDESVRTEWPYGGGVVTLRSDAQENLSEHRYRAQGNVRITYKDFVITGDAAEYDAESGDGVLTGKIRFSQKELWLICSRAEFNFKTQTGVFYDASGYMDGEFFITGRTVVKTGGDTYRLEGASATTCPDNPPKWSFSAARTDVRVDRTARMRHTVFKVKGVPVLYLPFVILPMEQKMRSSGFVPFHTGNSPSKGRTFSEGYYQTLGRSADLMVYGDYFSLRGLAVGGIFRARPNPDTRFSLQAYGIDDKLGQGGVQLAVDGESRFKNGWRAVARVNVSSNFSFRQAFAESFNAATVSQERAVAFLSRNREGFSANLALERQEVIFPVRSLVITKAPSLELHSLGTPLGRTPFVLGFRASLDGVSRTDSLMETPKMVQRLDVYPRLSVRLPSVLGFSLMPSVGIRETFYGSRLSETEGSGIENRSLHRRYAELTLEARMPVLEKNFAASPAGDFIHSVEPFAVYRRIHGIRDLDKTIRFDEQDAIADTNEIEYGVVNRVFRNRRNEAGVPEKQEFLSFSLIQKYYFDPTFGGAFRPGEPNAFYPMNSVTGFYQTTTLSGLAPLSAIFRLTPGDGIHNEIRFDFDTRLQRWRSGSLSTLWQRGRFFLAGTYFKTRAVELGVLTSNHVQGQIQYGDENRGISAGAAISYNLRTSQWLNSNSSISYGWDCCGVAASFNQFDLGLRTESRLSFSFKLKGIGSFGNIKRPESLF